MKKSTHDGCTCWLASAVDLMRFSSRRGAHSLDCPCYQESGDVVDRLHDGELRRQGEQQALEVEQLLAGGAKR